MDTLQKVAGRIFYCKGWSSFFAEPRFLPRRDNKKTIIELAEELNIPFQVKQLTVQDVLDADESFFSGTAAEVVPINSLDGQSIGTGLRGPITEKLQQTYFDQVRGERDLNSPWLTFTN